MTYAKFNINQSQEIEEFCKDNDIDFIQWASGPDRIYLTTIIKKGKCERKAKITFNDFEKALKALEQTINQIKEE